MAGCPSAPGGLERFRQPLTLTAEFQCPTLAAFPKLQFVWEKVPFGTRHGGEMWFPQKQTSSRNWESKASEHSQRAVEEEKKEGNEGAAGHIAISARKRNTGVRVLPLAPQRNSEVDEQRERPG